MNKTIYLRSLHKLYYHLLSMTDDEIAEFDINNKKNRQAFFAEMRAQFDNYGNVTQASMVDTLEYLCASGKCEKYWESIIPHEIPLDEIHDKSGYAHDLFLALTDREPHSSIKDTFTISYELAPRDPID
ncbi:hypothetical protein [Pseudomonas sp. UFMG81]|jgi:hypothetical protein|uniref:hypothetical protein n=1 Tax=Pseudomonas sp. UFMG81 TaxID=2745936 RepID=UPI00188DE9B8|nr:hypothetical protein [Pseudomonas sp. UFMG81]